MLKIVPGLLLAVLLASLGACGCRGCGCGSGEAPAEAPPETGPQPPVAPPARAENPPAVPPEHDRRDAALEKPGERAIVPAEAPAVDRVKRNYRAKACPETMRMMGVLKKNQVERARREGKTAGALPAASPSEVKRLPPPPGGLHKEPPAMGRSTGAAAKTPPKKRVRHGTKSGTQQ
jgi:hypothetical protein